MNQTPLNDRGDAVETTCCRSAATPCAHSGSNASGSAATLSRREVLKSAASAAGIAIAMPLLASSARADDAWIAAGKASDFAKDQPKLVTLPTGEALFITRKGDKNLIAVSAKCTHKGCELAWIATDSQLECPCHGGAFQTDGTNIHGTRRHPDEHLPALQTVPVRQKHDQVEVKLAGIDDDTLKPERG